MALPKLLQRAVHQPVQALTRTAEIHGHAGIQRIAQRVRYHTLSGASLLYPAGQLYSGVPGMPCGARVKLIMPQFH